MNKTKLITLSLVIALVLMGTAFALWTQNITVTNKITTGNLEVKLSENENSIIANPIIYFTGSNGLGQKTIDSAYIRNRYKNVSASYQFSPNFESIRLEANNMFPGSTVAYTFDVHNTGTVPVHVSNITKQNHGADIGYLYNLPINFKLSIKRAGGLVEIITENASGTYGNIETAILNQINDIVIYPGDKVVFGQIFGIDVVGEGDIENGFEISIPQGWTNETEGITFDFSLHFEYEQAR